MPKRIKVKAKKGLEFWCQNKRVTPNLPQLLQVTHDVTCKIKDGTLVVVTDKKKINN